MRPANEPRNTASRALTLALTLAAAVFSGVLLLRFVGSQPEQPLSADPHKNQPAAENQEAEVFFTMGESRKTIPPDTLTMLARGHVYMQPSGGGGWELKAKRSTTHLTLTYESDIGGTYRKEEQTIGLSALPLDFSNSTIRVPAAWRIELPKNKAQTQSAP